MLHGDGMESGGTSERNAWRMTACGVEPVKGSTPASTAYLPNRASGGRWVKGQGLG